MKTVIIRNNRFRDNNGWGIDLDDGSSNYHIYDNLCIGISIKLREGDYRVVENNIFVNGCNPPGFHIGYEFNHDIFKRNIIVMDSRYEKSEIDINFEKGVSHGSIYEIIGPPAKGPWFHELDNNLFFNDIGKFLIRVHFRPLGSQTRDLNLKEWNRMGFDIHSIYGDPMFMNPLENDYRLKPESPAYRLGFKDIDMSQYGISVEK